MRWSQLKQRVEANFAPRVRGDITFIQAEAAAYQPDRASIKGENPSREEYCAANRRVLGNLRACSNSAAPRRGWRRLNYRS